METYEERSKKWDEQRARLERQYSPTIIGWRIAERDKLPRERARFHRPFREVLQDADHEKVPGPSIVGLWPQGGPVDRVGVVGIFHPAFPGYMDAAKTLARATGRDVHVAKERDARWVYFFCHNPFAGCGVEECDLRREEDPSVTCEPCSEWFDTDYHVVVHVNGDVEIMGIS